MNSAKFGPNSSDGRRSSMYDDFSILIGVQEVLSGSYGVVKYVVRNNFPEQNLI